MNLWIVNHYATDPRASDTGQRHHRLAIHLVRAGWDVTIIGATTLHPSGSNTRRFNAAAKAEMIDGVRYYWLWAPSYDRVGLLRPLNMVAFAVATASSRRLKKRLPAPDVIVGSTVHPLAALAAYKVARRLRAAFVYEVRDLWPETLIRMGVISEGGFAARLLGAIDRILALGSHAIVCTMPLGFAYYEKQYRVRPSKVHWISNGVEPSEFLPDRGPSNSRFTLTYTGSLGPSNGVELIIEGFVAAREARPSADALLRVVGSGPELPALRAFAERIAPPDAIEFIGRVPRTCIPSILSEADALIAALVETAVEQYGVSLNKVFEYMASARPVVLVGTSRANPLEDAGGCAVTGLSAEAVAEGIVSVIDMSPEERATWGKQNSAHVESDFSYAGLASRYDDLLREVAGHVRAS